MYDQLLHQSDMLLDLFRVIENMHQDLRDMSLRMYSMEERLEQMTIKLEAISRTVELQDNSDLLLTDE